MTFAIEIVNLSTLTPVAVFGAIAALAWWALDWVAAGNSRTIERLAEFRSPGKRRTATENSGGNAITRALEQAAPALAKPLQPKNEAEVSTLRKRLTVAGFRGESAVTIFLGLKFAGLVVGLFAFGGASVLWHGLTQKAGLYTVLLAGALFYLPELVVSYLGKRRKQAIFLALPDALDLMVVCVEAGLGLDQAMRRVADEMKDSYPVLCEEFALANFQLQMGRPRAEVLHELGNRTDVSDLRALGAVLIQADKFGSSVAQALRVQSDSLRTRRRQMAEEKAAKTAVKLIFPLVLFIFPGIFIVLVGPAAITMARELFPKMGG